MTRKEAIAFFRNMNECTYGNVEPIQMAIKALEQEPFEDVTIDKHYWKGFNNGIRTEKFRESKRQEPCDDAISRQAVLDAISELNAISFYEVQEDSRECYYEIENAIKQLPPVTPTQRWIPVSERLPKEDNEVLITIKSCGEWYVCHSVYRSGLFWQKNFEYNSYRNPIAWMPLPEPYKAESEE